MVTKYQQGHGHGDRWKALRRGQVDERQPDAVKGRSTGVRVSALHSVHEVHERCFRRDGFHSRTKNVG